MTQETENPPNCETCPHAPAKVINKRYDKFDTYKYFCRLKNLWIFGTAFNTMEITGCCLHPLARTWLNRIAIEKLTRLTHCKNMLDDGSCRYDENCEGCNIGDFEGSFHEIREALALLKDEVK